MRTDEIVVGSDGIAQVGFATTGFVPSQVEGVGDDPKGWGYDGNRVLKWHDPTADDENYLGSDGDSSYGERWQEGDVIGCLLDLTQPGGGSISFSLTTPGEATRDLGVAFELGPQDRVTEFYPAGTFVEGIWRFRFGAEELQYAPDNVVHFTPPTRAARLTVGSRLLPATFSSDGCQEIQVEAVDFNRTISITMTRPPPGPESAGSPQICSEPLEPECDAPLMTADTMVMWVILGSACTIGLLTMFTMVQGERLRRRRQFQLFSGADLQLQNESVQRVLMDDASRTRFRQRYEGLQRMLHGYGRDGLVDIVVARPTLLRDTVELFGTRPDLQDARTLRSRGLRLRFVDEAGIDEGGLRREFFNSLFRLFVDPAAVQLARKVEEGAPSVDGAVLVESLAGGLGRHRALRELCEGDGEGEGEGPPPAPLFEPREGYVFTISPAACQATTTSGDEPQATGFVGAAPAGSGDYLLEPEPEPEPERVLNPVPRRSTQLEALRRPRLARLLSIRNFSARNSRLRSRAPQPAGSSGPDACNEALLSADPLALYQLVGEFLAKAIIDDARINVVFCRTLYSQLLGQAVGLADLKEVDSELHTSLTWLLENDLSGPDGNDLGLFFDATLPATGGAEAPQAVELKPGGSSIAVTEANKREFVELRVAWALTGLCEVQLQAIREGFFKLLPDFARLGFDGKELELLLHGVPEIDVEDWQANTQYRSGFEENHPTIVAFWAIVESWDGEMRGKLLHFTTGSSRVPLEGFSGLRGDGMRAANPFTIVLMEHMAMDALPRAHCCFNRLEMPAYPTEAQLRFKLEMAVCDGHDGFGLA